MSADRLALILAGVGATAASGQSAISADTASLFPPYRSCLMNKAVTLEPYDADVHDIVNAAISACRTTRTQIQTSLDADFAIADSQSDVRSSPERTERTLAEIDRRLSEEVNLAVLEKRAARKRN